MEKEGDTTEKDARKRSKRVVEKKRLKNLRWREWRGKDIRRQVE